MTRLKWFTAALLAIGAGAGGTAAVALQQAPGQPGGLAVQAGAAGAPHGPDAGPPAIAQTETPPRDRAAEVEDDSKDSDEIARLERELQRAKDRLAWAERMYEKGYVSRAQMLADLQEFEQAKSALWLARKRQREPGSDKAGDGRDGGDVSALAAQIRAKRAELRSWEARLKQARAVEASKSLLREKSEAEWKRAEAEVAAASATCNLKQAELRVLELRSTQTQRRPEPR